VGNTLGNRKRGAKTSRENGEGPRSYSKMQTDGFNGRRVKKETTEEIKGKAFGGKRERIGLLKRDAQSKIRNSKKRVAHEDESNTS